MTWASCFDFTDIAVERVYPRFDNLRDFPDPLTGEVYSWLTLPQLIQLAEQTVDRLVRLDIAQVLVSETGAVPYAKVCAWISRRRKLNLQWYSIKVPRRIEDVLAPTLQHYLEVGKRDLALDDAMGVTPGTGSSDRSFADGKRVEGLLPRGYFEWNASKLEDTLRISSILRSFHSHESILAITQGSGLSEVVRPPSSTSMSTLTRERHCS